MSEHMEEEEISFDYPITIALAFLFLAGYLVNRFFVSVKLPGAVGVIVVGFCFQYFIQEHVLEARNELQELVFFLVLLTAGFEITLPDLNWAVFLMSWLPVLFEIGGLYLAGRIVKGFAPIESLVCACVLCPLGDGLVIPKMRAFTQEFPGHTMPRLLFTWAPLEASLVLTLFGVLTPMAQPEGMTEISVGTAMVSNVVIIVATLIVGGLFGCACAKVINNRDKFVVGERLVFTGTTVEAYLMIFSVALFAFGCGLTNEHGDPFIPLGFAPGSLLQPELVVIVVGSAFSFFIDHEILHSIEATAGGVWVFGQLILFAMLGSKSKLSDLGGIVDVSPFMIAGLVFRLLGIVLSMLLVRTKLKRPVGAFWSDVFFCFVSVLPRATLQGALGSLPKRKKFFSYNVKHGTEIKAFIHDSSRLYILLCAVAGSILVDVVGKPLLTKTYNSPTSDEIEDWEESAVSARRRAESIGTNMEPMASMVPMSMAKTMREAADGCPMCQMDTVCLTVKPAKSRRRPEGSPTGIDLPVIQSAREIS